MKEKIITAMYQLVAKQGYEKTSLSQLAQAVSIQKPSIYYHFKSKEDIFIETVKKYYCHLYSVDMIDLEHFTNAEEFEHYLSDFGTLVLQGFHEDYEMQQFYCEVNLQSLRIPSLKEYFEDYDNESQKYLTELFQNAQDSGILSKETPISVHVDSTIALFIGLSEMILYHMKGDYGEVWKHYVKTLF